MSKYAVIEIGGKQYSVKVGELLEVQKLDANAGQVIFDQVLLAVDGDEVQVGTPTISGLTVSATFVDEKKGEKIQVFKYKSKSKYRKMRGARQTFTYLKIDAIGKPEKKVSSAKAQIDPELIERKAGAKQPAPKTVKPATKNPAVKKSTAAKKVSAK